MSDGLVSPHWYRVAKLKPRLHDQVQIHRHDYRGLIWYLLENRTTGRSHRFNSAAYQFIGLMDGKRSVQEIFDLIGEQPVGAGQFVLEDAGAAGEKDVGEAELRNAPAVPSVERGVEIGWRWRGIAFDDRHVVAVVGQHHRCRQTTHPTTGHHHVRHRVMLAHGRRDVQ